MSWRQMLLVGAYVGFIWALWPLPLWRFYLALVSLLTITFLFVMAFERATREEEET